MTASEQTYQNFFFSGEIPCQKKATGEKKCVSALQFFSQPEGYVTYENQQFSYVYQYKDHLGNVRLSYTDTDASGDISQDEIIEESSYYPFGLKHKGYNNIVNPSGNSVAQRFKYQGQELTEELGLNMYEFKYRFYDAAIGRFLSIDPLANVYVYNSTYAFQENKLGLGSEFEGKEIRLHDWLVREGVTYVAKELDEKMTDAKMQKTEKSVARKNLYQMYKLQKSNSKGIAEKFAENSGLKGLRDGNADAFRHSLFNALNTQTVGEKLTKELGDAHEEDRPLDPKGKKMDLHNNKVGREVGKENPKASILETATKLLDKLADGEMVSIDSKGNVTKTKLTKEQKAAVLKNIQDYNKKREEDEKRY
ncbi:MAG: hypothetical protein GKR88_21230 [Flavobacteriaceae bacterium]|nr:MAG: hypothetical protein GKR88_21230 [Flavobacteriaceae bacterium]